MICLRTRRSGGSLTQVRSTPVERSDRRSASIGTSPTDLPTPRMPSRMDLTATKIWKNSWQRRSPAERKAQRVRFARAARM